MKTTETNILNAMHNNHRILIDKITEYDYNGDIAVVKKMCIVIRYDNYSDGEEIATPMIFNVSPYTGLVDMHTMARVWIDCGCPSDGDYKGVPRKWTKDSLHAWVAS